MRASLVVTSTRGTTAPMILSHALAFSVRSPGRRGEMSSLQLPNEHAEILSQAGVCAEEMYIILSMSPG